MITREDAGKLVQYNDLGDRYTGVLDLAETVVALYDEVERLREERGAALLECERLRGVCRELAGLEGRP